MSTEEQIKKDDYYMGRALALAEEAYNKGEIPVGAVIVCRDKIIDTCTQSNRGTDRCYCTC